MLTAYLPVCQIVRSGLSGSKCLPGVDYDYPRLWKTLNETKAWSVAKMSTIESSPIALELGNGEKLLWSGRPKQGIVLRPSDAFLIPFSLFWGGFALFWETMVVTGGAPFFFMIWGLPFLAIGAYMTVGRFFVDAYIRTKTYYGLTNQRAIIISGLINGQIKSVNVRTTSEIALDQRSDGSG